MIKCRHFPHKSARNFSNVMKFAFIFVCLISLSLNKVRAQAPDFIQQEAAAKQAAIREFPDLKDPSSALYQLVQAATVEFKKIDPKFFKDPEWPLNMARACSKQLLSKQEKPQIQNTRPLSREKGSNTTTQDDLQKLELAKQLLQWQNQQTIQQLEAMRAISKRPKEAKELDQKIAMLRALYPTTNVPQPRVAGNQIYPGTGSGHWIKDNINRGEMILLEDGSLWKIDPLEKINAMLWLKVTKITVVESYSGSPGYNYLLINTEDREKVHAQYLGNK